MNKKVFETPEMNVILFDQSDILTLSAGESGEMGTTDFSKWN